MLLETAGVRQLVSIKIGRPAARTFMNASLVTRELLSGLTDSQLSRKAGADLLDACELDESALACWSTYHLIGDQLRSPASPYMPQKMDDGLAFARRLSGRLAGEMPVAGVPVRTVTRSTGPVEAQRPPGSQAANDSSYRRKLVASAACLAAVCAVAWTAFGTLAPSALPQLAQAPAPQIVVASPQGPVVRDLRLEELLTAHRQFGAATALQESSGFLRNATFEAARDLPSGSGR